MNNGKKEYPVIGLEQDVTYARKFYCYLKNIPGIKSFTKTLMNRRFRRFNKNIKNFE